MSRWIYLSVLLTLAAFVGSLYVYCFQYDRLPEWVPTHWNIYGKPDRWTSKESVFGTLLLLPTVMAGVVLLTLLLPWLSPRSFDVDRFRNTYHYVMALVVALLGFMHATILLYGSFQSDKPLALARVFVGGIFLFLALLGNVLGQVRRNFWMGVRTPWTLASERVWNQTHRLAARLLLAAGLVGFVAVLVGVPLLWCFVGLMVIVLVPVVYSLILYKRLESQGQL